MLHMSVAEAQQRISGAEFAEWGVFLAAEAKRTAIRQPDADMDNAEGGEPILLADPAEHAKLLKRMIRGNRGPKEGADGEH